MASDVLLPHISFYNSLSVLLPDISPPSFPAITTVANLGRLLCHLLGPFLTRAHHFLTFPPLCSSLQSPVPVFLFARFIRLRLAQVTSATPCHLLPSFAPPPRPAPSFLIFIRPRLDHFASRVPVAVAPRTSCIFVTLIPTECCIRGRRQCSWPARPGSEKARRWLPATHRRPSFSRPVGDLDSAPFAARPGESRDSGCGIRIVGDCFQKREAWESAFPEGCPQPRSSHVLITTTHVVVLLGMEVTTQWEERTMTCSGSL